MKFHAMNTSFLLVKVILLNKLPMVDPALATRSAVQGMYTTWSYFWLKQYKKEYITVSYN